MENQLWGMPLEVAVGLIGLGGALIGAFVAAAATIWVARWQARETLRLQRLARLDDAVMRTGRTMQRLTMLGRDATFTKDEANDVALGVAEVKWRARGIAPGLVDQMDECAREPKEDPVEQARRIAEICAGWLGDPSHTPGDRR